MAFLRSNVSPDRVRARFRWSRWLWLLLPVLGVGAGSLRAALPAAAVAGKISAEYQLKAVFLFNFAQFVEWPDGAFENASAPLVIGILGDDPFGAYLDELVSNERIRDRSLVVKRYARPEEIGACHVLFLTPAADNALEQRLTGFQEHSLLTVGESENFNRAGGIVRFVTEKGKIRFRINMESATKSNLTISSKLLRLATIVNSSERH